MTIASGEQRWVRTDKVPLLDEQGTVTGILVFVVDITERKRALDALALANKKLSLLSGITCHDIGNQLMALNVFINLSTDAIDNPTELREFFAKELKITAVLEEQISFMKDYEEIGVNSPIWQDVSALIMCSGNALPLGNIRLEIRCSGLEVYADPLLEKVFFNLIDNSLYYGGENFTSIRVTAQENDDNLGIIFEDNGSGIVTEDKKQLFTKGFGKRTGLGLFLSREILSITGITITENGIPGQGARFELMVPKGEYRFLDNINRK
jgi:signal transduction histidine kinase